MFVVNLALKNMKFIIPLFALVLLASCKDQQKVKYLNELQVMEKQLDSLDLVANDTTGEVPFNINMSVRNTILKVKNNYLPDTIDYAVADMMNDYKEIRKVLSKNGKNLEKVNQAIPEVKQKVKDLYHDIENGAGERERYREYVDFEKSKIENIKDVLSYYVDTKNKYFNRYDSLHPIVSNFADSLVNAQID